MPSLPDTSADASPKPFVQLARNAFALLKYEVINPTAKEATKNKQSMLKCDLADAAENLAESLLELVTVLIADANLTAEAVKAVAKKLDSFRSTNATRVTIDHQFQMLCQKSFDRGEHTLGMELRTELRDFYPYSNGLPLEDD